MPTIEKKLKETYNKLKQLVRKAYQGNNRPQWVLQPVPLRRFEGADQ